MAVRRKASKVRKRTRRSGTAGPRASARGSAARTKRTSARGDTRRAGKAAPAPKRPKAATARPRPAAASNPLAALAPNGQPVGSGVGLTHHHMDYSSHDVDAMRRFFVETLGFTNVISIPEHGYLTVFITPTSSLGFMRPASEAPEHWQPPGEPNLYFFVADVDAAHRALSERGVIFEQAPADMPWGHRLAVLRDPEGRRVCLAQNLKR